MTGADRSGGADYINPINTHTHTHSRKPYFNDGDDPTRCNCCSWFKITEMERWPAQGREECRILCLSHPETLWRRGEGAEIYI